MTQEITSLMETIFYSQFINTGIVLLIANANFEKTPLSFIPIQQLFPDYTSDWYLIVGDQIIKTMIVNAFYP